jgi:transcriptional regulator with XRE-family HTH domain
MYKPRESKVFGLALKQLLKERSLSHRQFAKQAGLETSYMSKLLNPKPGKEIAEPRRKTRQQLAKGLGITEQQLLEEIARYSDLEAEKTISSPSGLAESEKAIAKPNQESEEIVGTSASEPSPEQVVLDQSKPNHSLPDQEKNTLDASHLIAANSFLEYFSKAIDQLESQHIHVRIGAISNLGKLAKLSQPEEHWTVMEYLAAFIRNATPRQGEEGIPDDIQAALTVIGRRDIEKDPENQKLNLIKVNIAGANLCEANLQNTKLFKANLQGANLAGAKLKEVELIKANLQRANLWKADLQGAYLLGANLQGAILYKADLQGAFLKDANLTRTPIKDAVGDSQTILPKHIERPAHWNR